MLLTADQPAANYWITVASQFRVGAPAGYGVLSYAGAPNATAATLPTTPALQPANITANLNLTVRWNLALELGAGLGQGSGSARGPRPVRVGVVCTASARGCGRGTRTMFAAGRGGHWGPTAGACPWVSWRRPEGVIRPLFRVPCTCTCP